MICFHKFLRALLVVSCLYSSLLSANFYFLEVFLSDALFFVFEDPGRKLFSLSGDVIGILDKSTGCIEDGCGFFYFQDSNYEKKGGLFIKSTFNGGFGLRSPIYSINKNLIGYDDSFFYDSSRDKVPFENKHCFLKKDSLNDY